MLTPTRTEKHKQFLRAETVPLTFGTSSGREWPAFSSYRDGRYCPAGTLHMGSPRAQGKRQDGASPVSNADSRYQ